jgi:REP element-mobilizing transposase RayT
MEWQIRHNVEGRWYHITTRGMGRREIFSVNRDRKRKSVLRGVSDEIRRERKMKGLDVKIRPLYPGDGCEAL